MSVGGHTPDTTTPTWTARDGKTLNLCLNGKTLSRTYTVFTVTVGGTLNICDCGCGGKIENTNTSTYPVISSGDSVGYKKPGTLNLYGGTISGSCSDGTVYLCNNGGNKQETEAVFNMYVGNIICEKGNGFKFNKFTAEILSNTCALAGPSP